MNLLELFKPKEPPAPPVEEKIACACPDKVSFCHRSKRGWQCESRESYKWCTGREPGENGND